MNLPAYHDGQQAPIFSALLKAIQNALPPNQKVYLVGGAIRDMLLQKIAHDLDFVLTGEPKLLARLVAKSLDAGLFILDDERNTVRVIYSKRKLPRFTIDFSSLRGPDVETDLRLRDFTINAIAVDIAHPDQTIDPLGGVKDLVAKQLRACSPKSFEDDPLRVLRAIRLSVSLTFQIEPETQARIRQAVPLLSNVSMERKRDELFRIFEGPQPVTAIRLVERFDCINSLMPELTGLKGVHQTAPHQLDVWEHTLSVVQSLQRIIEVLSGEPDSEKHANYQMGLASYRLGRYRDKFKQHLLQSLNPNRTHLGLLTLAALYHDVAKPGTAQVDTEGKIRNFGHEKIGAEIVFHRAQALQLSNIESERLKTIIRHHMRIHSLVQAGQQPTRRAVYRFFRDTGSAGVDICLLTLADTLGTYGTTLPQEIWIAYLDTCRVLLENWWEKTTESIRPNPYLNGHELQELLGMRPGPRLGRLIESIREAQAVGEVTDKAGTLDFAREWLDKHHFSA